jgi:osmotically-inducible protein OsmY
MRYLIPLLLIPVLASACTPIGMATGAAATTGMAAAQEGGISRAVSDTVIKAKINDAWLKYSIKTFTKLDTTVSFGRVLITGVVQDPQDRVEAVRLAWQVEGVKQVINEIRVAESEGVQGFIRDNWISTRLRTAITFAGDVQSINYTIDTVQGVVYLMGVAQNQKELAHVIEIARTIPHVKQVVSYVKMAGEAPEAASVRTSGDRDDYPPATGSNTTTTTKPSYTSTPSAGRQQPIIDYTEPGMDVTGPPGQPATVESEPLPLR